MTMPKVSVIIPTYNREHCIAEAIESVLAQTYGTTEIIVVDDGSTDRTAERVAAYGDRVTYIHQENAGPSRARNRGIRESSGELIAFLDSDDLWLSTKLARQVEEFLKDDELGIVATPVVFRFPGRKMRANIGSMDTAALREHFLDTFLMVTSTVMVRRRCLEEVGLFNEALCYAEDMDLFYRIVRAYGAKMLGDYLTVNRRAPNSNLVTDTSRRERLVADSLVCIDRIFSYPENRNKERKKRDRYRTFFRWIGMSDVHANPRFARTYLWKALSYKPWDYRLYWPLALSFLLAGRLRPYLRKARLRLSRS